MAGRAMRKRQRVNYKESDEVESGDESSYDGVSREEEESEQEEEEEYLAPPPRKRPRTNSNKQSAKVAKDTDEKDEDEDDDVADSGDDDDDKDENTNTSNRNGSVSLVAYNALKQENKRLKAEISRLQKENEKLKAGKGGRGKPAAKVDANKLLTRLSKALVRVAKLKKTRFYGWSSDIAVEQPMDYAEFDAIFKGKGHKIQPLPDYKPKSVKTVIRFESWPEIKALFDGHNVELPRRIQVSLWRMGSIFRGKSYFRGVGDAMINSMTVEHNRSQQKIKLTFSASQCEDNEVIW